MFKMSFQRAARTDKGVSAAANMLSLKMVLDENETLPKLNEILPKQIRVFAYNKVTQGFDCKNNCDGRTYIYVLPTFSFCPIEEVCHSFWLHFNNGYIIYLFIFNFTESHRKISDAR